MIEELSFPVNSPRGHHDLRTSGITPSFAGSDGGHRSSRTPSAQERDLSHDA